MSTLAQRTPFQFTVTVDMATAGALALYSKSDPAQYAAGLLMRTCKTAVALGCKPDDVPTAAVVHSCTCGL